MTYHRGHWITARYPARCRCGAEIYRGDTVLYLPAGRRAICKSCGEPRPARQEAQERREAPRLPLAGSQSEMDLS